ncbi:hypothetical protein ACQCVK_19995 [Rossellomorea vietnamensis]|uniref:Uncharacterized protein n=1 Tax=Rossellomorea aquimaris TaxID=189382 RepID=A0A5D4TWY1_9BACI|nr:hypothetical protein [Rossellomorea aquimaris]TYS79691.1 hypothetical protein FZC80_08575 [Rossellomorea aquimaris]
MKILRMLMAIIGLVFLLVAFYHFFIDSSYFPSVIILILGLTLFVYRGFEIFTDRRVNKKSS